LGRSQFEERPGKSLQDTISTNKKLGTVVCACHLNYPRSVNRRIVVYTTLGINRRPYSKNNQNKKGQVVEYPPSNHKSLSSNASSGIVQNKNEQ
jgi:hypothetical protein